MSFGYNNLVVSVDSLENNNLYIEKKFDRFIIEPLFKFAKWKNFLKQK